MNMDDSTWKELVSRIGLKDANKELDDRFKTVFETLRELTSVYTTDSSLTERVTAMKDRWIPARDQYERSVMHMASMQGNTQLVRCLVYSGCPINLRDGIGQTPLTLALHMGHTATAKFLVEYGASVREALFKDTVSPLEIAKLHEDAIMIDLIERKLKEENEILHSLASYYNNGTNQTAESGGEAIDDPMKGVDRTSDYARVLNINVGDQKNTVLVQGCANRCPDIYGCHTPGGGDFHNRGYINECIARTAGPGGFWHVTEKVLKRPTVNPNSFKLKFKDNNYNNNEEALLDYDDGLSISMLKSFEMSPNFPTSSELDACLSENGNHNEVLLKKLDEWLKEEEKEDEVFKYHSQVVNDLMPVTRWYKESVRHGNGAAIEGVWMICPALYAQLGKINYRDEAFSHTVNAIAKWPEAYRLMYRQNRTVNLNGTQGSQLAGDEWVEGYLVRPVKQFSQAQSSFAMVELMSCSIDLLELNREMYKHREAFDIHTTTKHKKPPSMYDKLKVAQFAAREKWFHSLDRKHVIKYTWADKQFKEGEKVQDKYLNVLLKAEEKASNEFKSFLERKFPNDML